MPAKFELITLGIPRLITTGGHDVRVRTRKHMALLVYLGVLSPYSERRDRLVDLLWPQVPQGQGRGSLATALSALRAKLGRDTLETERDLVRIRSDHIRLDIDYLATGEGLPHEFWTAVVVDSFLSHFEVEDAPEFQIWRDRQRGRLLPTLQRALATMADQARRTANLDQLSRCAARLLELNDLSEHGVRAQMEAFALAGDRITALRIYEEWSARLRAELGARPSELLEGMAMRLRIRGLTKPNARTPQSSPPDPWRERPFVGRTAEYRLLYELWEEVPRLGARHCLVHGCGGAGKTTLADRFAAAVAIEGATVARVKCFELEQGIPYAAIGGAVAALIHRPGAVAADQQSLAELAKVVPAVRHRFENLPDPSVAQGEAARIRFADALCDLLAALMEESPVVLIVDDYHLADDASLAVLHLLVRRLTAQPFMVVLTAPSAAHHTAPSARRIQTGSRHLGVIMLELGPLSDEDMLEILNGFTRDGTLQPEQTERRMLLRAAGGNPLALDLMFHDWRARGSRSLAFSLGAMTAEVTPDPTNAFDVLAREFTRNLTAPQRMALHLAAILDHRLGDVSIYRLVGLTPTRAMAALTELSDAKVLCDTGHGLAFVTPSMRAEAYLGVPASLRRALHGRVADYLLRSEEDGDCIPGLEIAWHTTRAGRPTEAAPYLTRGAREAIDAGAAHEARLALSSGITLLDGAARDFGYLLWAEALQELGMWRQSCAQLDTPKASQDPEVVAVAELLDVNAQLRLGALNRQEAINATLGLIGVVNSDRGTKARCLALGIAAAISETIRDMKLCRKLQAASMLIAPPPEEAPHHLQLLLAKAMLAYQERDISEAVALLAAAESIADQFNIRNTLHTRLVNGAGAIAVVQGAYEAAIDIYARAHSLGRHLDNDFILARAEANLALCHARLGNYDCALEWSRKCVARGTEVVEADPFVQALGILGASAALVGRREAARDAAAELEAVYSEHEHPWLAQRAMLYAADAHWLLGERHVAFRLAVRGTSTPFDTPHSLAVSGPFCRWTALLIQGGILGEREAKSRKRLLARLIERRERFDAMDLAEALSASRAVLRSRRSLGEELRKCLTRLPGPVTDLLALYELNVSG